MNDYGALFGEINVIYILYDSAFIISVPPTDSLLSSLVTRLIYPPTDK